MPEASWRFAGGGVTRRLTAGASWPVIVLARGAEVPLEAILADD